MDRGASSVCLRVELQCNSQKQKLRLQRTPSMKFFTAKPCAACQSVGVFHWVHVVDCVSCASAQAICVDALGSTHKSYWTKTRRESGPRSWFFVKRFSHDVRWLRALLSRPGPLRRTFTLSVRRSASRFHIRTDTSPSGDHPSSWSSRSQRGRFDLQ